MRIAAQKINNRGIEVSRTKVRQTTEKYVKQLGQTCEKLHSMGYIGVPTYYDEDEFMKGLFEEFPDLVPLCRNVTTGKISLSDKQMSYVLLSIGHDHEAYDVLRTAQLAAQASQALYDISEFLSKVHFKKKDDLLLCRSSIAVSSRVYSSGKLSLDSPYLRECFYIKPGMRVVEFNYSIELLNTVLKAIGVETEAVFGGASFFLGDGFKVEDDCEFLEQLISGDIHGVGELADKLHEAVQFYYSDYYNNRTTIAECIKYEEQSFINAIRDSIASINAYRYLHPDYEEFFVDSKRVYFLAPAESVVEPPFIGRDIFIGESIASLGQTPVSLMNRLLGYSGEFLYRFDNAVMDYEIMGMPIILYTMHNGKRVAVEYYPAVNLNKKIKNMRIPANMLSDGYRPIQGVDAICAELQVDTLDTLDVEVAELVEVGYKTHAEEFKLLVGLLVRALVCTMCDFVPSGAKSPNHVHLDERFGWVTDEIYLDACAVAETFYGNLGF